MIFPSDSEESDDLIIKVKFFDLNTEENEEA